VRNAELVATIQHLAGERLVEFPKINIRNAEAMALQKARHRNGGSDAHFIRLDAGGGEAPEYAQRL